MITYSIVSPHAIFSSFPLFSFILFSHSNFSLGDGMTYPMQAKHLATVYESMGDTPTRLDPSAAITDAAASAAASTASDAETVVLNSNIAVAAFGRSEGQRLGTVATAASATAAMDDDTVWAAPRNGVHRPPSGYGVV